MSDNPNNIYAPAMQAPLAPRPLPMSASAAFHGAAHFPPTAMHGFTVQQHNSSTCQHSHFTDYYIFLPYLVIEYVFCPGICAGALQVGGPLMMPAIRGPVPMLPQNQGKYVSISAFCNNNDFGQA